MDKEGERKTALFVVTNSNFIASIMMLKDYYRILEITPQATPEEIKKSFRRLAMQYHPDKHQEDQIAGAHYREIQEAYETLTDPNKKESYLQQRWYEQSMGRKLSGSAPLTSSNILRDAVSLEKYISTLDPYRIDQEGLLQYIEQLLSDDAIDILEKEHDQGLLKNLLAILLKSGKGFSNNQAVRLVHLLEKISPVKKSYQDELQKYLADKKREALIDRWKIPLIIFITILICLIIFLAGN